MRYSVFYIGGPTAQFLVFLVLMEIMAVYVADSDFFHTDHFTQVCFLSEVVPGFSHCSSGDCALY